ncbi:hypothetical protein ACX80V_17010 [Arthrobacter sp. MDT3-24]
MHLVLVSGINRDVEPRSLDHADQERSWFGYAYSVYQVEYSRNLISASGAR